MRTLSLRHMSLLLAIVALFMSPMAIADQNGDGVKDPHDKFDDRTKLDPPEPKEPGADIPDPEPTDGRTHNEPPYIPDPKLPQ